ncbi:MAG: hypothetical protein ACQESX_07470 [Bacteroidota bacterium]
MENEKPLNSETLKSSTVVFAKSVYDTAKKSSLLFTKHLKSDRDLGTAKINYIKPREGNPFFIIQFEKMDDSIGVMMGDLKDAIKADAKAPDAMIPVKKSNKITGYKLNPNAKFAWDSKKRAFLVKS